MAIDLNSGYDIGSRGRAQRVQRVFVELDFNAVQRSRGVEEFGTFDLRDCQEPRDEGANGEQVADDRYVPMRTHGAGFSGRTTISALAIGRSPPSLG